MPLFSLLRMMKDPKRILTCMLEWKQKQMLLENFMCPTPGGRHRHLRWGPMQAMESSMESSHLDKKLSSCE